MSKEPFEYKILRPEVYENEPLVEILKTLGTILLLGGAILFIIIQMIPD